MKKILLLIAMTCSINMFSVEKKVNDNVDPLMIYTSCGTSYEYDDTGMSWDDIFDLSEDLDWFDCGGGSELIFIPFF